MHEQDGLVGRVAQTVGQHADVLLHVLVEECAHRFLVAYLHAEETVGLRRLLFGSDEQRTVEQQAQDGGAQEAHAANVVRRVVSSRRLLDVSVAGVDFLAQRAGYLVASRELVGSAAYLRIARVALGELCGLQAVADHVVVTVGASVEFELFLGLRYVDLLMNSS